MGINIGHNEDGTVTLTQPKLLQKVFKEHPEQPSKRKARTPVPSHNKPVKEKEQSPPILVTTYLRLLGLLMYLIKSRPDIMAAVSFGATKSTNPTEEDYQQLYYIVDYLRVIASKGRRIFVHIVDSSIQLYCDVDASYLIHPDSKGRTGYTIGRYLLQQKCQADTSLHIIHPCRNARPIHTG